MGPIESFELEVTADGSRKQSLHSGRSSRRGSDKATPSSDDELIHSRRQSIRVQSVANSTLSVDQDILDLDLNRARDNVIRNALGALKIADNFLDDDSDKSSIFSMMNLSGFSDASDTF